MALGFRKPRIRPWGGKAVSKQAHTLGQSLKSQGASAHAGAAVLAAAILSKGTGFVYVHKMVKLKSAPASKISNPASLKRQKSQVRCPFLKTYHAKKVPLF